MRNSINLVSPCHYTLTASRCFGKLWNNIGIVQVNLNDQFKIENQKQRKSNDWYLINLFDFFSKKE